MKIFTFSKGRYIREIQCEMYVPMTKSDGTCIRINKCEKAMQRKTDLCIVPQQWVKPDISIKIVRKKVADAKKQLAESGYIYKVTADDLIRYFQTDTFYQDIGLSAVLKNEWLIIHELVEIQEIKRMGLRITRKIRLKYNDRINKAHIIASEIEIEAARMGGDTEHIRKRYRNIKGWLKDPSTPSKDKKRIKKLCLKVKRYLRELGK